MRIHIPQNPEIVVTQELGERGMPDSLQGLALRFRSSSETTEKTGPYTLPRD